MPDTPAYHCVVCRGGVTCALHSTEEYQEQEKELRAELTLLREVAKRAERYQLSHGCPNARIAAEECKDADLLRASLQAYKEFQNRSAR